MHPHKRKKQKNPTKQRVPAGRRAGKKRGNQAVPRKKVALKSRRKTLNPLKWEKGANPLREGEKHPQKKKYGDKKRGMSDRCKEAHFSRGRSKKTTTKETSSSIKI